MTGSKTLRAYVTDSGQAYTIGIDKSNADILSSFNNQPLALPRASNLPPLPIGVTPRVIYCWRQGTPNVKRAFTVGNPAVIFGSPLMDGQLYLISPDGTGVWIVTGYRGEKISCPTYYGQVDTGLDDGSLGQ